MIDLSLNSSYVCVWTTPKSLEITSALEQVITGALTKVEHTS